MIATLACLVAFGASPDFTGIGMPGLLDPFAVASASPPAAVVVEQPKPKVEETPTLPVPPAPAPAPQPVATWPQVPVPSYYYPGYGGGCPGGQCTPGYRGFYRRGR